MAPGIRGGAVRGGVSAIGMVGGKKVGELRDRWRERRWAGGCELKVEVKGVTSEIASFESSPFVGLPHQKQNLIQ